MTDADATERDRLGQQRVPEGLLILEERTQANCAAIRFPSAAGRASIRR